MLVGYARTSTIEQKAGLEAQIRDLECAGVEKLFTEQVSSVGQREQLDAVLDFVRDKDMLVITKLDRLARSTMNLLQIVELLDNKGAGLRILDFGGDEVNTRSPNGKLMLTMFSAIGQFERELMLERQREGIAKAKAEGKYKGRQPTALAKTDKVISLRTSGSKPTDIAKELGIGRASVYRILKAANNT